MSAICHNPFYSLLSIFLISCYLFPCFLPLHFFIFVVLYSLLKNFQITTKTSKVGKWFSDICQIVSPLQNLESQGLEISMWIINPRLWDKSLQSTLSFSIWLMSLSKCPQDPKSTDAVPRGWGAQKMGRSW